MYVTRSEDGLWTYIIHTDDNNMNLSLTYYDSLPSEMEHWYGFIAYPYLCLRDWTHAQKGGS